MAINLVEEVSKHTNGSPCKITFVSASYQTEQGQQCCARSTVIVGNGDVLGTIAMVKENGGIGHTETDGSYVFVTWPCAVVEVREITEEEYRQLETDHREDPAGSH